MTGDRVVASFLVVVDGTTRPVLWVVAEHAAGVPATVEYNNNQTT
jgi:hypothetical protein